MTGSSSAPSAASSAEGDLFALLSSKTAGDRSMRPKLDQILMAARELGASDIHLIRGVAPAFRVNGDIRLAKLEPLDEEALKGLLDELLDAKHKKILEEKWQLCFSRHWPGVGRFRASIYFHGGVAEMAIRVSERTV